MWGERNGNTVTNVRRRGFLRAVGVGAASVGMAGTASAYHENYDTVVDIVDEGADNSGKESINSVLDDLREDSILIKFPRGEYKMTREFRHTNFDEFGMVGDKATIRPVPAHRWNDHEHRMFRLGTYANPGDDLRIDDFTFDFTASNTGLRAIETQVASPYIWRVTVKGRHDTGNWGPGPMLVDVTDPDGVGRVNRVRLIGGGKYEKASNSASRGPIGFSVTPYHRGTLHVRRTKVFNFPSNGFYSSTKTGRVVIRRGRYKNNNIANIRLSGHRSKVKGANVVVRRNPDRWTNQRGIRLDGGHGFVIEGVNMWHPKPNGSAIRVTSDAGRTRIEDTRITMGNGKSDAISISNDTGPVDIYHTRITKNGRGQAIQIRPGGAPVLVFSVRIDGDAPGGNGGSHAIRCERDNCEFRWLQVDQPGPNDRRCFTINGDGCRLVGGRYRSTHHPIVIDADDADLTDVTARAYNDAEGVKVYSGHDDIDIVESKIWNGIKNYGSDVDTRNNTYPES